jgi:hypothetical protein
VIRPEPGDGGAVRATVGGDEPERDVLPATPLNLAGGPDADAVGVEEQRHHHRWVVGGAAPTVLAPTAVEGGEVQAADEVDDEARGGPGQPVIETRREEERLVPVAGDKVVGRPPPREERITYL